MQVVTCYFPRWALGKEAWEDDGDTVGDVVGKRNGGPIRGAKRTATRAMQVFGEYVARFKEAKF